MRDSRNNSIKRHRRLCATSAAYRTPCGTFNIYSSIPRDSVAELIPPDILDMHKWVLSSVAFFPSLWRTSARGSQHENVAAEKYIFRIIYS